MQPYNDRDDDAQLRGWLREWKAPATPPSLEQRVLATRGLQPQRQVWWRFLLGGYIRVPVSVACALALLMSAAAWRFAVQPPAPCIAAQCEHSVLGVC
jgi:hypothetical protein